jgi:predicted SprT family Zn-dependent metalloprotease
MFHVKQWTQSQLNQLLQQVINEAKALGIPVSRHISPSLFINNRTKSRFGGCKKVKGFVHHTYQIEISKVLLEAEADSIREIIAHEVLHTCPGCMNHGTAWKNYCKMMEGSLGYRLERTSSYDKLGIEDQRHPKRYRYVVECNQCGQKIYRQRKSPLTDKTNRYRCRCGGKLVCFALAETEGKVERNS